MMNTAGYFDLQVNGYAGADFNHEGLTAEAMHAACERLQADGVSGILATVITDQIDRMMGRLRRIVELRDSDELIRNMIAGIHIEGPFINESPGYVGAHPADAVRPANVAEMNRLLEAGGGLVQMVTLAPERDEGMRVTKSLSKAGIVVSAGHCNPSRDELLAAIDAGLSMFTHLGNGCPGQLPRHDNIIQRVLSLHDHLWITFIADGVHVPPFALGNYLDGIGLDRAILVTDAIAAAGLGPGRYTLGEQAIVVADDLAARFPGDDSHLAGSAVTMPKMAANLRQWFDMTDEHIAQLLDINPRRALA